MWVNIWMELFLGAQLTKHVHGLHIEFDSGKGVS